MDKSNESDAVLNQDGMTRCGERFDFDDSIEALEELLNGIPDSAELACALAFSAVNLRGVAARSKDHSKTIISANDSTGDELSSATASSGINGTRLVGWSMASVALLAGLFCLWQGYRADLAKTRPIETIQPLDRVVVNAPQAALDADHISSHTAALEEIGPQTHRVLVIQAIDVWEDGTVDDINVKTVQPLSWLEANDVQVGSEIPMPLDLVEMGLPSDLLGRVKAIQPCPQPKPGTGRLVLTTVNHLNRDVVELTLRDANAHKERLRPTGTHKFYSVTRNEWLSASELHAQEQLNGVDGLVTVISIKQIPGTHRVYNMTVQGEHLYRVAQAGVLVHNMDCVIHGNPQFTSAAHAAAMKNMANKMAKSGAYSEVFMHTKWSTILNGKGVSVRPNQLPDVVGVRLDGRIDIIEFASSRRDFLRGRLLERNVEIWNQLPDNFRGDILVYDEFGNWMKVFPL